MNAFLSLSKYGLQNSANVRVGKSLRAGPDRSQMSVLPRTKVRLSGLPEMTVPKSPFPSGAP